MYVMVILIEHIVMCQIIAIIVICIPHELHVSCGFCKL